MIALVISNIKRLIINFFLECSGTNKLALVEAKIETPKFVSIGATIFLTSILASLSGGYAIYFSFNSVLISIFFGVLWGVVIFNLDRYIIISIDKNSLLYKQIITGIPRLLISFILAITISKPLELRIFENSINQKIYENSQDEINKYDSLYLIRKKNVVLINDKKDVILLDYEKSLENKIEERELLIVKLKKADSLTAVYLSKRLSQVNKQVSRYDSLLLKRKQRVYSFAEKGEDAITKELSLIDSLYIIGYNEIMNKRLNSDVLVRLSVLSELKNNNSTIFITGGLITLLFILIEMSPVLIKLTSKKGIYDIVILAKHNELMIKQKAKLVADRQNSERFVEEGRLLNKLIIDMRISKEKSKIGAELTANESLNAYIIKKQTQLSKLKVDEWYDNELTIFNKSKKKK